MAHLKIEATPERRNFFFRHKIFTAVLVVFVLMASSVIWFWATWTAKVNAIPRFEWTPESHASTDLAKGDGTTILMVGADNDVAAGTLREMVESGDWNAGQFRSDTIIVLHVEADGQHAQMVSIPRDTWVPIDGYGNQKINAAFSYGGPALLANTVENLTGIYIDHVALVDLDGFKDITETVGGVDVYVPQTVTDTYRAKTWTQGWHTIEGDEALMYVRQRAGLPRGDLDRIDRQQNFLRAVLDKTVSRGTLTNPSKVLALMEDLTKAVAVDEGFTGSKIRELAIASRAIRSSTITFTTVPVTGFPTINGASTVSIDVPFTRKMFAAIAEGSFDEFIAKNPITQLPSPGDVN